MGLSSASHKCWCPSWICSQSSSHSLDELISSVITLNANSSHPGFVYSTLSVHLHKCVLSVPETQHVQNCICQIQQQSTEETVQGLGLHKSGFESQPHLCEEILCLKHFTQCLGPIIFFWYIFSHQGLRDPG